MSGANYTPENIRDDEDSKTLRAKIRNNLNYISLAVNASQSSFAEALKKVSASIIKPAIRGGFNVNDIRYSGTLPTAVAQVPTASFQTVYVTNAQAITANLTVPANIALVVPRGGTFAISGGATLTINGPFDGQGQALADLFTGAGAYVFGKAVQLIGSGSPESVVSAPVGSEFLRNNGAAGSVLYVKESGTGNTGWLATPSTAANNTFSGTLTLTSSGIDASSALQLISNQPSIRFSESDAAADKKEWGETASGGTLAFFTRTDALGIGGVWLSVNRTGATPTTVNIGTGSGMTTNTNAIIVAATSNFGGSVTYKGTAVSTDVTLDATYCEIFVDCSGANRTETLPTAVGNIGLVYWFYKTDSTANTLTIDGAASETIDGATTVVLGGNTGLSRLGIVSNGTNWLIKALYEEGTYTATLTGCTTSPTATIYYVKSGKLVTLKSAATLQATSNTTAATLTGMPAHLFPTTALDFPLPSVRDAAGLTYVGLMSIDTGGVCTLVYQNTASTRTAVFTNSGTKGIGMFSGAYTLQ